MYKLKIASAFLGVFIIIGLFSQVSANESVSSQPKTGDIAELQAKIRILMEQIQILQEKLRSIQGNPSSTTTPMMSGQGMMRKEIRKNVCFGAKNDDDVKEVQERLRESGHFIGESTGNFGPMTREAVMKFQKERGVSPTNCVGPITRGKFDEEIKSGGRTVSGERIKDVKITPEAIRIFPMGIFTSEKLVAHGFSATSTLSWSVTNGNLPSGVALAQTTPANIILIQGTPTAIGEYEFTLNVTDGTRNTNRRYVIRVKSRDSVATTSATVQ
ncbi:MAG: peptidoglycan-binding protein [Patescibacteria group bacterium]